MGATTPATRIARDQNHLAWDPAIPPGRQRRIGRPRRVRLPRRLERPDHRRLDDRLLATLDFASVDQVTGPVEVAGAEPGDTLQVDLLEFEPADWGWTASIPGFGLLADDFPDGR